VTFLLNHVLRAALLFHFIRLIRGFGNESFFFGCSFSFPFFPALSTQKVSVFVMIGMVVL